MMRWAVLGCVGCGEPLGPTPELVPATDRNPDPDIVEIDLVASAATVQIVNGKPTPVLAYNGSVPGPLIEATRGDRLIVHFKNELDRTTTVHWHGLRLPIDMDGDPMAVDPVPP